MVFSNSKHGEVYVIAKYNNRLIGRKYIFIMESCRKIELERGFPKAMHIKTLL